MAATLSNILSFPQSAPTNPTGALTLSGSIANPDGSGNIPDDGTGILSLSIVDATGSLDGTVDMISVTLNNETQGSASAYPSASFPPLVGGAASLSYTVPAPPPGTNPGDVLSVSVQASTPGATSGLSAAETAAAASTRSAEMANRPGVRAATAPKVDVARAAWVKAGSPGSFNDWKAAHGYPI